jgi:hypothetical protein
VSATPHGPAAELPTPWPGAPPDRFPRSSSSLVLVASHIIVGERRLFGFQGWSTKGTAQFIHAYDDDAVPANGSIPLFVVPVAATSNFSGYFGSVGRWFSRGIVLANSTTADTLTAGAADCLFDVQYY